LQERIWAFKIEIHLFFMSDIRESILKQELQKELTIAKRLEAEGKIREAGIHYIKAGALTRRIATCYPVEKARVMFDTASQYEQLGAIIKATPSLRQAEELPENLYEQLINSLIVTQKPDTTWDDIGGLDEAKKIIKEAIILPFIKSKPAFVKSPKTILLYGPPGTGKTLLAKAASNTLAATFFEARLSALLSKYFGESPKLVSALFTKARKMQPSLIFIDELDAMAVSRSTDISEASRRVLGQLLTEIEGFNTPKEEKVIVMGATNKPWDLDDAMVSRFLRKIYVPLPDQKARKKIIKIHLSGSQISSELIDILAEKTENWSGRDLSSLCQEAIINMVRECNPGLEDLSGPQLDKYILSTRALELKDFESAFKKIRPAVTESEIKRYEEWRKEYGG
jgi:SpoVK/Ycf46/Vps4 family AAA+-type ATPase